MNDRVKSACRAAMACALIAWLAGCATPVAPSATAAARSGDAGKIRLYRIGDVPYDLTCPEEEGNPECWVPLVVKTGGENCEVAYLYENVNVWKNTKVIWYLNQVRDASGTYEFDSTSSSTAKDGIDIKNNTDFDNNGHHNGKKHRFTWKAKNNSSRTQHAYDIYVYYVKDGTRYKCKADDPYIVNQG
ncbi:hypothetical protein HLB44_13415 [Aquincola sp. S2]|uniref:Lipoprotein n=1 Tax=Pseudaquabacterium terrae TaxID=2732868 RepID=A0ABX2EH88_9BURK|nr:hypothetical protein [Aquabacterium terrae]NRF67986.1 hypothetical protein [Aquabacterium terrae]